MTAAKAAQLIEAHAYMLDPGSPLFDALAVAVAKLTPKPRKAATSKGCPVAARAVKACSGIGAGYADDSTAYLDTFGDRGSPEREAQVERLRTLPTYAQFAYEGMPAKLAKDPGAARTFLFGRMDQMERDDEAARATDEARAKRERETLDRALAKRAQGSDGWHWKEEPTYDERRAFEALQAAA